MKKHFESNINYSLYDNQVIRTIEVHTEGEYCRIALDCPEIMGSTMMEKKNYFEQNYDYFRTMLMLEPRGHHDMFGAFLLEPTDSSADFGIIFMDCGGYLNMCGHCTIGAVTAILEGGLMKMQEPETYVVLDTPAGIVKTVANCKNGKVTSVTFTNVPAFVYKENCEIEYDGKKVIYDICFGGSFFALVDTEKNFGFKVSMESKDYLLKWSSYALLKINELIKIEHPGLNISSVDLIENYSSIDLTDSDKEFAPDAKFALQNLVVFGDYHNPQFDRSPCGTGTSAKLAWLYSHDKLDVGDSFVYKSLIGTRFVGRIVDTTNIGEFNGIIPQVTGAAHLCGEAKWFMDPDDMITKGFSIIM